ncbi:hypothetical protein JAAARDRAFT_42504 [Jaapia argillacea MUCL 33604]|uniref:ADP-ribose 1''-phosphate phosphatase n=1 Tax=Jaapia argillacea MUCL 33604 TaxID=933084 RepID=A0A067PFY2_9AGAM|nr:hypothetical protein JAAARDRAFT_42504 [Jaapia argillacea MUCL 33604]
MLTYMKASLFTAPPDSILVHACNTQGSWGAGIALAFRSSYPRAYEEYKSYCEAHTAEDIVGTCLLIEGIAEEGGHDIACLFTSKKYGRGKDPKEVILRSTRSAVQDLIEKNKDRKALSAW